jgi:hypothetical protein
MKHELKILPQFAQAICQGDKNFEIRKNDRGFQKGDFIHFITPDKDPYHNISLNTYEITYVLNGWGLEPGYVAFGIKLMDLEEENER